MVVVMSMVTAMMPMMENDEVMMATMVMTSTMFDDEGDGSCFWRGRCGTSGAHRGDGKK
jgi:hypothetical protein